MAFNESAGGLAGVVSAVNEGINGEDEWFALSALGEHPNEVGLQVVDGVAMREMVGAFNSLAGRAVRLFRGLPIYVGHPDSGEWRRRNPEIYAKYPHPVGRITAMEMRGDVAWFKPAFNEVGLGLVSGPGAPIESFSPAWDMLPLRGRGRGVFRPVVLRSIGLTNNPQIAGSTIGLNEAEQTQEEHTMPEWVKTMLGLPADATDEQVRSAFNERSTKMKNAEARVVTLEAEAVTLKGQLTTATNEAATTKTALTAARADARAEREARTAAVVESAINAGRIKEADKAPWVTALNEAKDFASEVAKLGSLQGGAPDQSQVADLGNRRGEAGDDGKVSAINEAIEAYAREHGLDLAKHADHQKAYFGAKAKNPALWKK